MSSFQNAAIGAMPASPREFDHMTNLLAEHHKQLDNLITRLQTQVDRTFGPRPADPTSNPDGLSCNGPSMVDNVINGLLKTGRMLDELSSHTAQLERL